MQMVEWTQVRDIVTFSNTSWAIIYSERFLVNAFGDGGGNGGGDGGGDGGGAQSCPHSVMAQAPVSEDFTARSAKCILP